MDMSDLRKNSESSAEKDGNSLAGEPQFGEEYAQTTGYANTSVLRAQSASPNTVISHSELRQPLSEPNRSPRSFSPQKIGEDKCFYPPPPQLFSTPVSPNKPFVQSHVSFASLSVDPETMGSQSGNPYDRMKPTAFAPTYTGIRANPYERSYLTACGNFEDRARFTNASHGGVHTVMSPTMGEDDTEGESIMTNRDITHQHALNLSSQTSERDVALPSAINLDPTLDEADTHYHHQKKTFSQLAAAQGIKPWNHAVLDERWLEALPNSTFDPSEKRDIAAQDIEKVWHHHSRLDSFLQELDGIKKKMKSQREFRPDPSIWGLENTYPAYPQAMNEERSSTDLVLEPPEPQRLRSVVLDLEAGTDALPCGLTHHPDVLRRFFYDRVFEGRWDGPILSAEGDNMTKHAGKFISLRKLRELVLKDIEDLIAYMTAPIGERVREAVFRRTPDAKPSEHSGYPVVEEPYVPSYLPGINSRGYRYSVRGSESRPTLVSSISDTRHAADSGEKSAIRGPFPKTMDRGSGTPAHQPFMEGLMAIEERQPFMEQLHLIESRGGKESGGKLSRAEIPLGQQIKGNSANPEASSLNPQHIKFPDTASRQLSSPFSSSQATLAFPKEGAMDEATIRDLLQQMSPRQRQAIIDSVQRTPHAKPQENQFSAQLPPQHHRLPTGAVPTGTFHSGGEWQEKQSMSTMYPGHDFQPLVDPYDRPFHAASQSTQHAAQPMQHGFQPSRVNANYLFCNPPPTILGPPLTPNPLYSKYGPPPTPKPRYTNDLSEQVWNKHCPPPDMGPPASNTSWTKPASKDHSKDYDDSLWQMEWGPPPPNPLYGHKDSLNYPGAHFHTSPGQTTAHSYSGPHMHPNAGVRPPSTNRVAGRVYRENLAAWDNPPIPQAHDAPAPLGRQTEGTPAAYGPQGHATSSPSASNLHEWQNRFGVVPTVKPDVQVKPYRTGSDDMRPHAPPGALSVPYRKLTRNLVPTFEDMKASLNTPFAEIAKETKPPQWGVLKIGNIPYDITKAEITTFLGTHAKTINPEFGPAIHIIMDRVSGKTMDCYVEFLSTLDARNTSNSIHSRQRTLNWLSNRLVDVSVSSQDEFLTILFPKAKFVTWRNGVPIISEPEEEWSSGFKNFVSAEELGLMVKHAELPHRTTFTLRSPQRVYEAMITLLAKFPWYSVTYYNLSHRNQIFNSTRQMLQILIGTIRKEAASSTTRSQRSDSFSVVGHNNSPVKYPSSSSRGKARTDYGGGNNDDSASVLNHQLLFDFMSAALNAPGFSERQRYELYELCDYSKHLYIISPMLKCWPFEVLARKPRIEEDVMELYARILSNNPEVIVTGEIFGSLRYLVQHIDTENLSMDAMGCMEIKLLEALLEGGIENANREKMKQERGVEEEFQLLGL